MSSSDINLPSRPRTRVLPPVPFACALFVGWWTNQHALADLRWATEVGLQPLLKQLGWATIAGGLLLMLWSVLTLWRYRTTVNPFGRASALCTEGPFALSRNPIYLADFLILMGGGWVLNSIWPLLLAPAIWWLIRHHVIAHEETFLRGQFGATYEDYCLHVGRWFGRQKKTPAQGRG